MQGEIAATKDGKILGVRVDVLADHGAFNATAQPTKYPAGFFHIFTGCYDLEAAHCKVTGVYTNKAPGGVAYACSFRITEAVYLVERMVDCLAARAGHGPGRAAAEEPHPPGAVPVQVARPAGSTTPGDYEGAMRMAMEHRRLRRPAPRAGREARARRADGHRRRVLHRGRRRRARASTWTSSGLGMADGAELRVHPTGKARSCALGAVAGPGPRDDVRPDRRRGARHPAGGHRGRPRRHRPDAVRPRHLRRRARRRSAAPRPRSSPARCATRRRIIAAAMLEARPGRPGVGEGPLVRQGRPGAGRDDPGDRARRARHARAARGRRGQPRRRDGTTTRRT